MNSRYVPTLMQHYWRWEYSIYNHEWKPREDKNNELTYNFLDIYVGNCFRSEEECLANTELRDELEKIRKR